MDQNININELLTPEQAADRLGVTVDTVRQYARAPLNRLKPVKIFGRLAFTVAEIDRYRADLDPRGRKSEKN